MNQIEIIIITFDVGFDFEQDQWLNKMSRKKVYVAMENKLSTDEWLVAC